MSGKKTIEEILKRLEEITCELESGESPLDELLKFYEESAGLVEDGRRILNEAKLKLISISKNEE